MSNTAEKPNFFSRFSPLNWIAIVLFVLAVIFVLQNRGTVTVDLFWLTVQSPQWLNISVVFLIGWLTGYFSGRRKKTDSTKK